MSTSGTIHIRQQTGTQYKEQIFFKALVKEVKQDKVILPASSVVSLENCKASHISCWKLSIVLKHCVMEHSDIQPSQLTVLRAHALHFYKLSF